MRLEASRRPWGHGVERLVLINGNARRAATIFGLVTSTRHVALPVGSLDTGQGDIAETLRGILHTGVFEVVGFGKISVSQAVGGDILAYLCKQLGSIPESSRCRLAP